MAGADYKSCDNCGSKCFYDAVLDYDFKKFKETGLYSTGDHKALCTICSVDNELVIVPKVKVEQLEAKVEKLKALILLVDPVVADVEVGSTQITQWSEFTKCFPEEKGV